MDLNNPGMSFGVRQFRVSQMSAQKPGKNMTPVQKNPSKRTNTYSASARRAVWAQCTDVFNCCSKKELAPAKYWQKTFPGIQLYCQSSAQRFPFLLPRDTRARWDIQPGQRGELACKAPALQTEIIFFSNISIKSVM